MHKVSRLQFVSRLTLLGLAMFTAVVNAQQRAPDDPWWFEIEAIIFERKLSPEQLDEDFPLEIRAVDTTELPDFVTDWLIPDFTSLRKGASLCHSETNSLSFPPQTEPPSTISINQKANGDGQYVNSNLVTVKLARQLFEHTAFDPYLFFRRHYRSTDNIFSRSEYSQWLEDIENTFRDLNSAYADWRRRNQTPGRLAIFNMMVPDEPQPASKAQLPESLYCQWPEETTMFETAFSRELNQKVVLDSVPKMLDGIEYPFSEKAYVLPASDLQLTRLKRNIQRTRGLNVMLHMAWRQNVIVGRDKAPWYRLFAGQNYYQEYQYSGLPVPEDADVEQQQEVHHDDNLFDQIQRILEEPDTSESAVSASSQKISPPAIYSNIVNSDLNEKFSDVWTLDGRIKIFIEYIGGTPYLHIDSDVNYRVPIFVDWMNIDTSSNQAEETLENSTQIGTTSEIVTTPENNFLQAYHFDQIRRVISNEIHYFDHPMFGMVFQIRRHRRPDPELPPDYYN